MTVADYSSGPIAVSALRGLDGVIRYVTLGSSAKRITAGEARALRAGGVPFGLVAEQAERTLASASWDAAAAARAMRTDTAALGYGGAVYQAADWDVQASEWPQIRANLLAIISVLGVARTGLYGPYDVLEWAHRDLGITLLWQSMSTAHSGGRNAHQHPHAVLWQRRKSTIGGSTVDLSDVISESWGQTGDDDVTKEEHDALMNSAWATTEIPDPAGSGKRVPIHVWADWAAKQITAQGKALAALQARPAVEASSAHDIAAEIIAQLRA